MIEPRVVIRSPRDLSAGIQGVGLARGRAVDMDGTFCDRTAGEAFLNSRSRGL